MLRVTTHKVIFVIDKRGGGLGVYIARPNNYLDPILNTVQPTLLNILTESPSKQRFQVA